jgi:dihydrofolate reductase
MRYWDEEHPGWDAEERAFAAAWRNQPKWVVSRRLATVGPSATPVGEDFEAVVCGLKAERVGEVAGPELAHSLTAPRLMDDYRPFLHPVVLGPGKPFFAGPRPSLRPAANDMVDEEVVRLTYVPVQWCCSRHDCAGASGMPRIRNENCERVSVRIRDPACGP